MLSLANSEICVAARASKLSEAQVAEVLSELRAFYPEVCFVTSLIKTRGDLDLLTSLRSLDKSDFFTREIDEMLIQGKCRIAIHSAKDLPEPLADGLEVVALTRGVDPRDSLVLRPGLSPANLPLGARIGTSSIRREEMIKALRQDLIVCDIRGTIDERLKLLEAGTIEGLIVAEAALIRLGLIHIPRLLLDGETAPLQGRLAVVARTEDLEMRALFASLDKKESCGK